MVFVELLMYTFLSAWSKSHINSGPTELFSKKDLTPNNSTVHLRHYHEQPSESQQSQMRQPLWSCGSHRQRPQIYIICTILYRTTIFCPWAFLKCSFQLRKQFPTAKLWHQKPLLSTLVWKCCQTSFPTIGTKVATKHWFEFGLMIHSTVLFIWMNLNASEIQAIESPLHRV